MDVILFETVPNLGLRGSVVKVKAGYFRNFLSPNGLAVEATPGNLKALQDKMKLLEKQAEEEVKAARTEAEKLNDVTLTFVMKAGDEGKLFGSVTNMSIAEELAEKGFEVDRRYVVIHEPIKRTGEYEVDIKIHHDVTASIKVVVEKEMTEEERQAEAEAKKKAEAEAKAAAEAPAPAEPETKAEEPEPVQAPEEA